MLIYWYLSSSTLLNVINNVFIRSGINTSAYMRAIVVNTISYILYFHAIVVKYYIFATFVDKSPFSRRTSIGRRVSARSRGLSAGLTRKRKSRSREEKGLSLTICSNARQQRRGAALSPGRRAFWDQCKTCARQWISGGIGSIGTRW